MRVVAIVALLVLLVACWYDARARARRLRRIKLDRWARDIGIAKFDEDTDREIYDRILRRMRNLGASVDGMPRRLP